MLDAAFREPFHLRFEKICREIAVRIQVRLDNDAANGLTNVICQQNRVSGSRRRFAERLKDRNSVSNRDTLAQEILYHPLDGRERQ